MEIEDNSENPKYILNDIFQENIFPDVKLVFKEGKSIVAHKAVLSMSSKFFKKCLENVPITSDDFITLIMPDIDANIIEKILNFLYLGEVIISSKEFNEFLEIKALLEIKADNFTFSITTNDNEEIKHSKIVEKVTVKDKTSPSNDKILNKRKLATEWITPNEDFKGNSTSTDDEMIETNKKNDKIVKSNDNIALEEEIIEDTLDISIENEDNLVLDLEEETNLDIDFMEDCDEKEKSETTIILKRIQKEKIPRKPDCYTIDINNISEEECIELLNTKPTEFSKRNKKNISEEELLDFKPPKQGKLNKHEEKSKLLANAMTSVLKHNISVSKAAILHGLPKTLLWRYVKDHPNYKNQRIDSDTKEDLKERLMHKEPFEKISEELNLSVSTIQYYKQQLVYEGLLSAKEIKQNIKTNKNRKNNLEKAIKAVQQGKMTMAGASSHYNVSRATLFRRLRK